MICASPSTASVRGSFAKRSASRDGSIPRRARVERTLSVIPFACVPTSANKNPFKLEFCNEKTFVSATTYTDNFLFYMMLFLQPNGLSRRDDGQLTISLFSLTAKQSAAEKRRSLRSGLDGFQQFGAGCAGWN
jgi:hypothetical protein